jgi:hypothetical protein
VLEPQLALLGERSDPVGGARRAEQPQDVGDVGRVQPDGVLDGGGCAQGGPQTSSASATLPEARAAAAVASATCWSSL